MRSRWSTKGNRLRLEEAISESDNWQLRVSSSRLIRMVSRCRSKLITTILLFKICSLAILVRVYFAIHSSRLETDRPVRLRVEQKNRRTSCLFRNSSACCWPISLPSIATRYETVIGDLWLDVDVNKTCPTWEFIADKVDRTGKPWGAVIRLIIWFIRHCARRSYRFNDIASFVRDKIPRETQFWHLSVWKYPVMRLHYNDEMKSSRFKADTRRKRDRGPRLVTCHHVAFLPEHIRRRIYTIDARTARCAIVW